MNEKTVEKKAESNLDIEWEKMGVYNSHPPRTFFMHFALYMMRLWEHIFCV
jgi:hypothetical protein